MADTESGSSFDVRALGLHAQFATTISQYRHAVDGVLASTKPRFRTDKSAAGLEAALKALSSVFSQADALIEKNSGSSVDVPPSALMDVTMMARQIREAVDSVKTQLSIVQDADLKFIRSAAVATLDQQRLKKEARKLAAFDDDLARKLTAMIPSEPDGVPPRLPDLETSFPDTDGDGLTNLEGPDSSVDTEPK